MKKLNNLIEEFTSAKKGDMVVYYTGYLAFDRSTAGKKGKREQRAMSVAAVGDYFYNLMRDGKVQLLQRRDSVYFDADKGPYIHDYIAVKC